MSILILHVCRLHLLEPSKDRMTINNSRPVAECVYIISS